jgi:S1-C subfamily serine protease
MTLVMRHRKCVFWLILEVSLGPLAAAQEHGSTPPDPMTRAVVQLLALGPGANANNEECAGTGFLVNEEGYLLTDFHVFREAQRCLARSPGTKIMAKLSVSGAGAAEAISCNLVGRDEVHDLVVMKTERPLRVDRAGKARPFLRLDPSQVAEGARVAVTGHPLFAWDPVTQAGQVTRRGSLRLSDSSAEFTEVLVVNVPLRPGNSGSPVYLAAGAGVVGIVEGQDRLRPSDTIAVPVRYAVELLGRYGVKWHAAQK